MSKKKYIDYGKLLEERHRLGLDEMSRISKVNAFNHFIDTMPLADVEEVRHGKWMIKNNKIYWQDKDSSSYELAYVIEWTDQHFKVVEPVELVEPVEHVESAKPMETERNWEAEYKRLKDEADVIYKELDQAQKELDCKNRELIQLKEEFLDLRRDKDYLNGKTDAYEYAIKCFEKGSWTNEM